MPGFFINPECWIDQIREGGAYLIGPTPGVYYTLDGHRIEVNTLSSPAQLQVLRVLGMLDQANCIQIKVTQTRTVSNPGDVVNLEFWIEPTDEILAAAKWGTPYAQPITAQFDGQIDVPAILTFSIHDYGNTVSWCHAVALNPVPTPGIQFTMPAITGGDFSQGAKLVINLGFPSGGIYATSVSDVLTSGPAYFQINGTDCLIDKPVGTCLRLQKWQADVGSIAQTYRPVGRVKSWLDCQQKLVKTHPPGIAVDRASPAGYGGSLKFFGAPSAAAGFLPDWRFPVPMLGPQFPVYTFSAGIAHDPNWFQANGSVSSGAPGFVGLCATGVGISNPATGYPNGSSFYLHATVSSQRGGNGWL